jgi:hypothetical protein
MGYVMDNYVQQFRDLTGIADLNKEKVMHWSFRNGTAAAEALGAAGGAGATSTSADTIDTSGGWNLDGPDAGVVGYANVSPTGTKKTIGAAGTQRWGMAFQLKITSAADANNKVFCGAYQGGGAGFFGVGYQGSTFGCWNSNTSDVQNQVTTTALTYTTGGLYSMGIYSDGTNVKFQGYNGTTDTGWVQGYATSTISAALSAYWQVYIPTFAGTAVSSQAQLHQVLAYVELLP